MRSYPLIINGGAIETAEQMEVINPATGTAFATCASATEEHIDQAVQAAAQAFTFWRGDEAARREALKAASSTIQARVDDIGPLLSQEQGKPLGEARGEVQSICAWLDFFAELKIEPPEVVRSQFGRGTQTVHRRPLGVVAAITPWNFPLVQMAWKIAPALLAGNTVVVKPSPFTPVATILVAEALAEVLPRGVLSVLSGDGQLGAQLAGHPGVRKITFTGSTATGKQVMRSAADDLKRVTLELGGNDAAIVLDDADPDAVAERLFWGAFMNAGQTCAAIKRLYVHDSIHDAVVERLADRAGRTKVGDGMDPETELGPLNNKPQFDKVLGYVKDARRAGGRIVAGGDPLASPGYFLPPTIITDVREGVRVVDEEQFGTVLPIIRYRDVDDAVTRANSTHYGLGGSVWSSDPHRAERVADELESGNAWVNAHPGGAGPGTPWCGHKWSGIGVENGHWGYESFTRLQVTATATE